MQFLIDQDVYAVTANFIKGLGHKVIRAKDVGLDRASGVILLRVDPSTINAVHEELAKFLRIHAGEMLANRFVVVEPGRHRVRTSKQS